MAALKQRVRAAAEAAVSDLAPGRRLRVRLALRRLLVEAGPGGFEVLDAGCENGPFALRAAELRGDWRLVGVDIQTGALSEAASRARALGLHNVVWASADLTRGLKPARFDAVVALECLPEIPDDGAALRAMCEALRPGGLFLGHVPRAGGRPVLPPAPTPWRHRIVHPGYSEHELRAKLEEAGFVAVRVRPTTGFAVQLCQDLYDRVSQRSLKVQAACLPLFAAAVWLDVRGIAAGSRRGLFVEARKPS